MYTIQLILLGLTAFYFLVASIASGMDYLFTGKFGFMSPIQLYKRIKLFIILENKEAKLKSIRETVDKKTHSLAVRRNIKATDLTTDDFEISVKEGGHICSSCFFQTPNQGEPACSKGYLKTVADSLYQKHLDNHSRLEGQFVDTGNIVFILKSGINVEF